MERTSEHFDFASPNTAQDPYPSYGRLIAAGGIERGQRGEWIVSAAELVEALLRDPRLTMDSDPESLDLLDLDGASHKRLREVVNRWFNRKSARRAEQAIRRTAREVIEEKVGRGEFDVVSEMARPIAVEVICEYIGVSEQLRERVHAASELSRISEQRSTLRLIAVDALARAVPDSVLAGILDHRDAGVISDKEAIDNVALLMFAGFETTVALITNAVAELDRQPGLIESLRAWPETISGYVEEVLRCEAPVQHAGRRVSIAIDIGDHRLNVGDIVVLLLGAANRDAQLWPRSAEFDMYREPPPLHFSFGRGRHYCPGADLARLEVKVVLEILLQYEFKVLNGELRYRWPANVRCPDCLPIEIHGA